MPDLSGNAEIPPLAGATFIGTWGDSDDKGSSRLHVGGDAVWSTIARGGDLHDDYRVHPSDERSSRGEEKLTASIAVPIGEVIAKSGAKN